MSVLIDRVGERRGSMVIRSKTSCTLSSGRVMPAWIAECDCGNRKVVITTNWTKDRHKSCGCQRADNFRKSTGTKGHARTQEYRIWMQMRQRCALKTAPNYKWYGGKGVKVCSRWDQGEDGKTGFECFIEDMGPRPDGLTIDRIDPFGNYTKANCRWATWKEQANNKRGEGGKECGL